jgi:hypothetical protein
MHLDHAVPLARHRLRRRRAAVALALVAVLGAVCGSLPAAGQDPPPAEFANRVESGWLPELCVRPGNPAAPPPRLRAWAHPRAGKRVRVLFICSSQQQYEVLSLAHAFDLEADILPWWLAYSWRENDADPDTTNLLRHYLGTRRYDVIAMASACLSALPDDCERKIAELIQDQGVGLVYALAGIFPRVPAMQGKPSPILDPLLPITLDTSGYKELSCRVLADGQHPLSRGADFARLQWHCNTDAGVVPGATVLLHSELPHRALAAAVTRGRGRVVAYNRAYGEYTYGYPFLPIVDCTGDEEQAGKRCRWLGQEECENQFYNWLGRTLLWAAQAEPTVSLVATAVSVAERSFTVTVATRGDEPVALRLQGLVRSPYDTVQAPLEQAWRIPTGQTETRTFPLPDTGRQGPHLLDLALLDATGRVHDWHSLPFAVPGPLEVALAPDFALHRPDEDVNVELQVSGLAAGTAFTVQTELFDLEGRLLVDRQHRLKAAEGRTPVTEVVGLGPLRLATALANLRLTVSVPGTAVELRDQLSVRQEPHWEQFHIEAYDGCGHGLLTSAAKIETLRRSGHDTILYSFADPFKARTNTETGLRCVVGHVSSSRGYDPVRIRDLVGWLQRFSPAVYEQQDEPELQVTPAAEARFDDPASLERFRSWLQAKYGTVEGLNQAWGTGYGGWGDLQRRLWHEVADSANWAPWFDSRRELDGWFVDRYDRCAQVTHELEPDRPCPINPRSVETFGGVNLREFTRRLRASSLYNHFVAQPPMGYLELASGWVDWAQTCAGYSWPSAPNPDGLAREAWDCVRHGVRQLAWFAPFCDETPPLGRFSYLAGDCALNAKGQAIARINRELLAGPADVAVNTTPVDDGVFIYYPRSLFYTHTLAFLGEQRRKEPALDPATLTGLGPWLEQLPNAFVAPLRALGFHLQFGDEADLTAERLRATKIVFLSHVVCLGTGEMELLRDFAKTGGCVVAGGGTARRDADGRLYSQSPGVFRELFGVERPGPNPSPVPGSDGVVACGAQRVEGVPPQLGAVYRNGRTFFLDSVLPAGSEGNQLVQQLLGLAGLAPAYSLASANLGADGPVASLLARRLDDVTWLYVLGEAQTRRRVEVRLPDPRQVYELTAARHLGLLPAVEAELRYGEARVFALSPRPPGTLALTPALATVRPGEIVRVDCTLAGSTGGRGAGLLRVECSNTQVGPLPSLPRLISASQGRAELAFFVPLNASAGQFELVVTDLATGARGASALNVAARAAPGRGGFLRRLFGGS